MKYVFQLFPALLIPIFAVSLYAHAQQTPSTLSTKERDAQVRLLRQQLNNINERLRPIEAQPTPAFNPRGPITSNQAQELPPGTAGARSSVAALPFQGTCDAATIATQDLATLGSPRGKTVNPGIDVD